MKGLCQKGEVMRISAINGYNSIYGKIASGKRIQTAADDAAGLAIANPHFLVTMMFHGNPNDRTSLL